MFVSSALLAVCASLCWGLSDFLGGLQARVISVLTVLAVSQPAGLVLVTAAVAAEGRSLPGGSSALLAIISGFLSIAALGLLYAAMTRGSMIIVAPLAASGAVIPVIIGLTRGEPVTGVAGVGIALALIGVPTAAWEPGGGRGNKLLGAVLAILAGLAVGLWFTLMYMASDGNPLGATEVMRLSACGAALILLAARWWSRNRGSSRTQFARHVAAGHISPAGVAVGDPVAGKGMSSIPGGSIKVTVAWLAVAAIGLTDAMAEISFVSASTHGELSIISPLSSLYPAITVLLAAVVLHERVHPLQALGAFCAMTGAILLSL